MTRNYTAKYNKTSTGYMGQVVEWPEVITEGKTIDECREMLEDALHEMILAYKQQRREIPVGGGLLEHTCRGLSCLSNATTSRSILRRTDFTFCAKVASILSTQRAQRQFR